jgi:hypothetical protein
MRQSHREERAERVRDEVAAPAPVSPAARMLALQRTAGNHAVAAMLAREVAPKQAEPAHGLAVVEGLGTIPLDAVSMGEARPNASSRATEKEKPAPPREITVMSKQGEHSAALALANQRGDVFEVELLVGEKLRLKLHKAMISAFSESGHGGDGAVDSWTLNAESIEFITDDR